MLMPDVKQASEITDEEMVGCHIKVPAMPKLGIELDEAVLATHRLG